MFEEALQIYDNIIDLKFDCYKAYNNSGNVLCILNRKKEAIEQFKNAIKYEPDNYIA